MCGIAVALGLDTTAGEAFVLRANRLLAHRGPDDEDTFVGEGVVLGHRRLAIVDLTSAARQPMRSPDGRWTLIYNGELYNHLSMRSSLAERWSFRSRSDSETVLAALALNGPAALEDMVGMWALALWDAQERRLLVARDRYGQKPLYWRRTSDGALRFASEIKALIDPDERPQLYEPAVAEFLATGNYGHLGGRTFLRDIHSFPPAHWAILPDTGAPFVPCRYWQFPIAPPGERRPYDRVAQRRFRDAFEEAVASQLMSDVPVGATLSGGLDSAAVVGAMAARPDASPIPVFTGQAPGSCFDESVYVRAVENQWNGRLRLTWIDLRGLTLQRTLPAAITSQEEPFGDPSIIAHGALMDAARAAGVRVVLGGQGGDELLFGYLGMTSALVAGALRRGRIVWALREAARLHLSNRALLRVGLSAVLPPLERRLRHRSRRLRASWLTAGLRAAAAEQRPELAIASDTAAVWAEFVERVALPHLTHYDDRSSMARSIESRMPFLDHRLAAVVGSLDERAFLHRGRTKRVLRDACGPLLPTAVLARRDKIGFFTPLVEMVRSEHAWIRSLALDEYARSMNLYDVDAVAAALDTVLGAGGADEARCVWRALAVRIWSETFRARSPVEHRAAA